MRCARRTIPRDITNIAFELAKRHEDWMRLPCAKAVLSVKPSTILVMSPFLNGERNISYVPFLKPY